MPIKPTQSSTSASVIDKASGSTLLNWTEKLQQLQHLDTGSSIPVGSGASDVSGGSSVNTLLAYQDSGNPYSPTQVTDPNGKVDTFTYDPFGTLHKAQDPRKVSTANNITYSPNPLGEVTSAERLDSGGAFDTQDSYLYYGDTSGDDPKLLGLVKQVTSEAPDNAGSDITSYSYDDLGNITQVVSPGPNFSNSTNDNETITTTYAYASPEVLGEPKTITVQGMDANGNTATSSVSYTYDQHGNVA